MPRYRCQQCQAESEIATGLALRCSQCGSDQLSLATAGAHAFKLKLPGEANAPAKPLVTPPQASPTSTGSAFTIKRPGATPLPAPPAGPATPVPQPAPPWPQPVAPATPQIAAVASVAPAQTRAPRPPVAQPALPSEEAISAILVPETFEPPQQPAGHPPTVQHPGGASPTATAGDDAGDLVGELARCWSPPQQPGELGRLGDYRILQLIGAGGMGGVFLAEDVQLRRKVALKIRRPQAAALPGADERFLREARAAAAIRHENVVTIYAVGQERGVAYLAQELLNGGSLESELRQRGRLPPAEAVEYARQILAGLSAAHAQGLIHRDVKPANIFLDYFPGDARTIKLLDFGLARAGADDASITRPGVIVGTPAYMAPEQASGKQPVDHRADLFSLGVVIYRMLTGISPFERGDTLTTLHALAVETPRPVHELLDVPLALSELAQSLLAKNPADRPSAAQVLAALGTCLQPAPPAPQPIAAPAAPLAPVQPPASLAAPPTPSPSPLPAAAPVVVQPPPVQPAPAPAARAPAAVHPPESASVAPPVVRPDDVPSVQPEPVQPPPTEPVRGVPPVAARPVAAPAVEPRLVWSFAPPSDAPPQPLRNPCVLDAQGRLLIAQGNRVACLLGHDTVVGPPPLAVGENVYLSRAEIIRAPQLVWEYRTDGFIPGGLVLGPDGLARVHALDGKVHAIQPDGTAAWAPATVGEPLGWAAPLADAQGVTWVCNYQGGLVRIDAGGQPAKRPFFRTLQKFDCTGLFANGVLYVGCNDHCVYALDLSGDRGQNQWDHEQGRGRTGWYINAAVARWKDTLVAVSRDDCLYGFSLAGEPLFQQELKGRALGHPVVDAQGRVVLGLVHESRSGAATGEIVCFNLRTRRFDWRVPTQSAVESTPVIGSDGTLYCGENAGLVHALDAQGKVLWTAQLPAGVRSCGAFAGLHRVAFGADDGALYVLECDSSGLAAEGWPCYLPPAALTG